MRIFAFNSFSGQFFVSFNGNFSCCSRGISQIHFLLIFYVVIFFWSIFHHNQWEICISHLFVNCPCYSNEILNLILFGHFSMFINEFWHLENKKNRWTDRSMDGQKDGPINGKTDGQKDSPYVLQDFVLSGAAALLPSQFQSQTAGHGYRWPFTAFGLLFPIRAAFDGLWRRTINSTKFPCPASNQWSPSNPPEFS